MDPARQEQTCQKKKTPRGHFDWSSLANSLFLSPNPHSRRRSGPRLPRCRHTPQLASARRRPCDHLPIATSTTVQSYHLPLLSTPTPWTPGGPWRCPSPSRRGRRPSSRGRTVARGTSPGAPCATCTSSTSASTGSGFQEARSSYRSHTGGANAGSGHGCLLASGGKKSEAAMADVVASRPVRVHLQVNGWLGVRRGRPAVAEVGPSSERGEVERLLLYSISAAASKRTRPAV